VPHRNAFNKMATNCNVRTAQKVFVAV